MKCHVSTFMCILLTLYKFEYQLFNKFVVTFVTVAKNMIILVGQTFTPVPIVCLNVDSNP